MICENTFLFFLLQKRICGKCITPGTVKAILRPLVCFVRCLNIDMTEDELREYLNSIGIHDTARQKLLLHDGNIFQTAAFRVACRSEFRDLLYDKKTWPEGCEVHDWFVQPSNNNGH